ncbi:MAG: hypothetical protein GSR72_07715 [Desulfurococcales archaeon]|nr:hypothetical protein [Desulfurococcales archaeon]
MKMQQIALVIIIMLLIMILALSLNTKADDNEYYEEYNENEGEETLGSIGFYGGLFATLIYIIPKYTRQYLGISLPPKIYKYTLDIHSIGNLIAATAAFIHGYINIQYATTLEYVIVALIIFLTISGLIMRYAKSRKIKLAMRLIHSQRILAIILLVLVLLHQGLAED